jgi:chemotaxis signal transduction protein
MTAPAPGNGRPPRATAFAVGGVEYLVTGRVARSLPAPRPLPPRFEHGGEEFPVVDLPALFGSAEEPECGPLLLLVERRTGEEAGGGTVRRALVVERLVGTEVLDADAVQPVPAVYPEDERRRWRGLLPRPDGRLAVVLRLEGLAGGGAPEREG